MSKQLEESAQMAATNNPDSAILQSVSLIGLINALTILAEGSDLHRLGHHRQLLKYADLI